MRNLIAIFIVLCVALFTVPVLSSPVDLGISPISFDVSATPVLDGEPSDRNMMATLPGDGSIDKECMASCLNDIDSNLPSVQNIIAKIFDPGDLCPANSIGGWPKVSGSGAGDPTDSKQPLPG